MCKMEFNFNCIKLYETMDMQLPIRRLASAGPEDGFSIWFNERCTKQISIKKDQYCKIQWLKYNLDHLIISY